MQWYDIVMLPLKLCINKQMLDAIKMLEIQNPHLVKMLQACHGTETSINVPHSTAVGCSIVVGQQCMWLLYAQRQTAADTQD